MDALKDAGQQPPTGLLDLALAARTSGLDLDDLVMQFEERAAICEYDGGMSRAEAEAMAWAEVVATIQGGSP